VVQEPTVRSYVIVEPVAIMVDEVAIPSHDERFLGIRPALSDDVIADKHIKHHQVWMKMNAVALN